MKIMGGTGKGRDGREGGSGKGRKRGRRKLPVITLRVEAFGY